MAASTINSWTASSWGWLLGGTGMLVTLVIWFSLVRKRYPTGSTGWLLNFGAIFAASLAFTWHSHVHMGMVLIPFLIILLFHHPSLGKQALDGWVFSFPAAMILSYLVVILLDRGLNLPINVNAVSGPLLGLTGLVFYMLFSYKILRLPETGTIS
jgi:hypothetical protein